VAIPHEAAASPRQAQSPQALADAVQDALGACAWRSLTATAVAALAVGAVDHARALPKVSTGRPGPSRSRLLRPASRDDERVGALVFDLGPGRRWRGLTLREVARRLVLALGAAEERSLWFDLELTWLLDPPA